MKNKIPFTTDLKTLELAVNRIELLEARQGIYKEKKICVVSSELLAKKVFNQCIKDIAQHYISNWSFSKTKAFALIKLFQNDILTDTITIEIGL